MLHKKQAHQIIEDICTINQTQWDNPRGVHEPIKGASLLVEEAFESIGVPEARDAARAIVATAGSHATPITEVDSFDAYLDIIYVAIGELHKLGLRPPQIVDGLQLVHNANLAKSGNKDATGKVTKPTDFVGPEAGLQLILDQRTS